MFALIMTYLFIPAQAAECQFGYINHGENLVYICDDKKHQVKIVKEKVVLDNKVASKKIQENYLSWLNSKKQNKNDLRAQKDKFNCNP